jgi:hypothetical protein
LSSSRITGASLDGVPYKVEVVPRPGKLLRVSEERQEALRLVSPVSVVLRLARADADIDGYHTWRRGAVRAVLLAGDSFASG